MTDVYAVFKFLFADHGKKTQIKADVIKHWESVNALQAVLAEATTRFSSSICDALMDSEFAFQWFLSS